MKIVINQDMFRDDELIKISKQMEKDNNNKPLWKKAITLFSFSLLPFYFILVAILGAVKAYKILLKEYFSDLKVMFNSYYSSLWHKKLMQKYQERLNIVTEEKIQDMQKNIIESAYNIKEESDKKLLN